MQLSVTLDPRKTYAATNPFVYGQSLEHTGGCIYEGLWAEMLEDRKFYYSPNDAESPWTVRGGCVEMVTTLAYAGAYSPTIWLPGGIAQAGLHLEAGREYALRLVVAGVSLRGGIEVALCWGEQPAQRAATVIERVGEDYAALTHSFVPGGTSINGRLEIVGHGKGAMRLGAVSLMPVDNIHGMRRDVLDALKRVNAPLYAWPTGGIADTYDWREGIGPRDRRPPRLDSVRKRLDSNDFGFEEFMALCAETGAEPLVLVNSSEGHVRLAVEQVRFANDRSDEGPAKSRVDGGRSEPYGVTWWGMGGQQHRTLELADGQLEDFRKRHNALAESIRAASPGIKLVCVGGTRKHWRQAILAGCALNVDLLSEECRSELRDSPQALMQSLTENVRECTLAYRSLLQTMPELRDRDIRLAIHTWCYARNTGEKPEDTGMVWQQGLGIAAGIHQFIRDSDVLGLAAYAAVIGPNGAVRVSDADTCLTPAGLVLLLYRNHFGEETIPINQDCSPLDVVAAWSSDRSALTVATVNPIEEDVHLEITFKDGARMRPEKFWVVTAPRAGARNIPGGEQTVTLEEHSLFGQTGILTCPPLSASIVRLQRECSHPSGAQPPTQGVR